MEWPQELLELFDDPLLDGVRPKPQALTADDRRVAKLQEITAWVEANGRLPEKNAPRPERSLHIALEALRREAAEALAPYDSLNLLSTSYDSVTDPQNKQ